MTCRPLEMSDARHGDGGCDFACRDAPAGKHDRDVARHQRGRGRDVECARTEIDLDRGLGPDGQAVADIAHVDAAIERRRAGIEKREFQVAVLRLGVAERNADDAAAAFAVEHDGGDGAVVDLHFEIAPRLVGAEIVEHQHQIARRHVAALRQRHEQFAMAAQIGETQAVDEADIGERDLGERAAWTRRGGRGHGRRRHRRTDRRFGRDETRRVSGARQW